jgi:hypothetical protein
MDMKEVAKRIIDSGQLAKNDAEAIRNNLKVLLEKYLMLIKSVSGEVPNEDQFIKLVSILIDEAIVLPQPAETLDGYIINFLLNILSKKILHKYLGKDWFDKLKKKIEG